MQLCVKFISNAILFGDSSHCFYVSGMLKSSTTAAVAASSCFSSGLGWIYFIIFAHFLAISVTEGMYED